MPGAADLLNPTMTHIDKANLPTQAVGANNLPTKKNPEFLYSNHRRQDGVTNIFNIYCPQSLLGERREH